MLYVMIMLCGYLGFNWGDAYPVARACDLIDDKIGAGDTFC